MVQLVVETDGRERELSVRARPDATVRDLVQAVIGGAEGEPTVELDGVPVDGEAPLAELPVCHGARLRVTPGGAGAAADWFPTAPVPVAELRVVGGLDAGRRLPLEPGRYVVGRDSSAVAPDITLSSETVSARHAVVVVAPDGRCRIHDAGSRNGVRVEGSFISGEIELPRDALVQLGAVVLTVADPGDPDRAPLRAPGPAGVVTFDRPPRGAAGIAAGPLRPPVAAADRSYSPRFSWSTVLAPLVLGGVMAALMPGNLMFLLFMLLSPVMAVANWVEERRRARREQRAGREGFDRTLATFRTALAEARAAEVRRRRAATPDLAETVRRALAPSGRLWERRPHQQDFGVLSVGTADQPWRPPLDHHGDLDASVEKALGETGPLAAVPVTVSLAAGRALGVVGPRPQALALARALVTQAAVHHGPADLPMVVLTEPSRVPDWDWAKWLPHVRTDDDGRLLAGTDDERAAVLAALLASEGAGPLHLVVMDADGITQGRSCPARELLQGTGCQVAALVLADRVDRLPAACTDIVEVSDPFGIARYGEPSAGRWVGELLTAGLAEPAAREVARGLSRYEDADLVEAGADLPESVPITALLGLADIDPDELVRRWSAPRTSRLAAPIGALPDRPLVVDLVADGPHGLIAGTTGSGKSELLRTIVASLAATHSPRDVTFVLIDYKGGSAFADCARLPHVVGLVTDLDDHLGSRALTCLEAEVRHRERLLRDAGATDLIDYVAGGEPCGPLPRLVVVIDEFATMAAELPDFVDALVGIAQRGRSLGVHLLLATQRPSGAVKENIRANTNLRIALRVQDAADSADVLDSPVAAALSRRRPGRGYLRLGPGELVAFQSGLVSTTSVGVDGGPPVRVRPVLFGLAGSRTAAAGRGSGSSAPDDLTRLVSAARATADRLGLPPARQPWPDPLPARLLLADLPTTASPSGGWAAPLALVDVPAEQRRCTYAWRAAAGGLLLYGVAGSGTSTALGTLAVSLAERHRPEDLHVYVLDFGTQLLAPLAALPHVGAVIQPAERERTERLLRWLRAELGRRQDVFRETGVSGIDEHRKRTAVSQRLPGVVLMIDNWSAFEAALDDVAGMSLRDDLVRVVADGPGLGIYPVITADRPTAIPMSVANLVPEKLVFRLSDPHDFAVFGLPTRDLPRFVPGRAVDAATRRELHVALPGADGLAAAVSSYAGPAADHGRLPKPVGTLPDDVPLRQVLGTARLDPDEWLLPVGVGDRLLEPVALRLGEGDHALVAGAARSGRSSLLCALATTVTTHRPDALVLAVAAGRSPLVTAGDVTKVFAVDDVEGAVGTALDHDGPVLLLVDDAERVEDASRALRRLVAARRPGDHIVAAGRADALRSAYGHWTEELRRSRQGVVLKPRPEIDGDLWGMLLPRQGPRRFAAGRGYLVADGEAELVQAARP